MNCPEHPDNKLRESTKELGMLFCTGRVGTKWCKFKVRKESLGDVKTELKRVLAHAQDLLDRI